MKAVHKQMLPHIVSFTHNANSFCILLLRIVAWGWSGAALGGLGMVQDGLGSPGTIFVSGLYPDSTVGWLGLA